MSNKEALRDLQARLAERLQAAREQPSAASWLAVECAGRGLLLPLADAGEIFAMTAVVPVAHVMPWFLGVANLRGGLHGVVDLAAFLGLRRSGGGRDEARLVALNAALGINAALLVDRLAGLRGSAQLVAADDAPAQPLPAFVGGRYRDEAGRRWQELRLSELARDEAFLTIVG